MYTLTQRNLVELSVQATTSNHGFSLGATSVSLELSKYAVGIRFLQGWVHLTIVSKFRHLYANTCCTKCKEHRGYSDVHRRDAKTHFQGGNKNGDGAMGFEQGRGVWLVRLEELPHIYHIRGKRHMS